MTATPDVVDAAVAQIEQGFAAFALVANGKKPFTLHGFKDATRKPDWIASQLRAPGAGNYGIVWPEDVDERVVVFDLDNGEDGRERPWQERLLEQIAIHGPLPSTKVTNTPSGGRHAFYRWPASVPIPPGDELFGFTVRWPGRGYLVGPGSSINGVPYVAGPNLAIADLPAGWVYAATMEHPPATARSTAPGGAMIVVSGGFELPDRIPAGRRYATVRDYVASRYNSGLSAEELWDLVRTRVAPRFETPKTEEALRGDFERATAKIGERLGPPARVEAAADAVAATTPIGIRNLADIAVEAVVWLWHRYLPVGSITLFDGNPGEGKSTIVADLIARLTTGGEWPDGTQVGPVGEVLYITKEDDPATQVRPRIEAAGGDVRRISIVDNDLLFPRDLARFRELLEATRPRLVLLDPLMSYLEGKVKVISDNEVRSAIMTPLAEVARSTSTAILVIRHFNKGSGQSALLRGAGSLGGLAGAARMVLALAGDPEQEDERARVFGVVKSNYEAKPPSLRALIESAPVEGFQMTVSRATWHGPSSTSVGDLMERTREEHQSVLDAETALTDILGKATEPMLSTDVQKAMKARGHGRNATYNAKRALKVAVDRSGFPARSMWSLPVVPVVLFGGTTGAEGDQASTTAPDGASVVPTSNTTGTTGSDAVLPTANTTGTTGQRGRAHTRDAPPNTTNTSEITGTTEDEAGASPAVVPVVPGGIARSRGRAHEAALTLVPDDTEQPPVSAWCRSFAEHQSRHRDIQTQVPWCEICTPERHNEEDLPG